jgi:large subunit ribosomal protein L23
MQLKHEEIILRPIVTERTMQQQALGKYTFQVHPKANKIQIRKAIEHLFKVRVVKVNTLKVRGKVRRFRHTIGKTSDWKKVIVTLKPGDKIIIKGIEMFEE